MERENVLHVHGQGGLGKCKVKAPHVTTIALGLRPKQKHGKV